MANALSVDRVVRVSVNLQPKATPRRNFGVLLLVSSDEAIDQSERLRSYTGLAGLAQDQGLASPVYAAGGLYFAQAPQPALLMVGRWVKEDAPAYLKGGLPAEADLDPTSETGWAAITDGSLGLVINGAGVTVSGLDFSGVTNLNAVASVISAALAADGAACAWTGERFVVRSLAAGAGQSLGFAQAAGLGTDIAAKAALTSALALPLTPGLDAESPLACVSELADLSGDWYGLAFVDELTLAQHLEVSGFVEAAGKSRLYLATETNSRALSAQVADDLASSFKARGRKRTFTQYSRNPHAAVAAAGRAFTVNFNANRSTITLKFKQEPGVAAEGLKESQALALAAKNCNVFVKYDNDTAILQEGVMASGAYFDEIHGLDWLQNAIQTECWNLLYQSKTKIGQTDDDVAQILAVIGGVMAEAVNNGLVGPGVWNADGFGELARGQYLGAGYYIYAQSVDDQAQSEREQRKAPPIQVAAKLRGAIHSLDVAIDVNR